MDLEFNFFKGAANNISKKYYQYIHINKKIYFSASVCIINYDVRPMEGGGSLTPLNPPLNNNDLLQFCILSLFAFTSLILLISPGEWSRLSI